MSFRTKEEIAATATIDPEFEQFLRDQEQAQAQAQAENGSITEAAAAAAAAIPEEKQGETLDIPMRDGYQSEIRIHRPSKIKDGAKPGPVVILLFGGGFQFGDNKQLSPFALGIAELYGSVVINPSYRLAPEHKFPAAPNDVWDTLDWIASNQEQLGIDLAAHGFIVGGVSAGANLSAACAQRWVNEKKSPAISGLVLIIPAVLRAQFVPEKYKDLWISPEQNAEAPVFNAKSIESAMAAYEPNEMSSQFSPFHADTPHVGMPPVYINVCGMDPLRDDGIVYHHVLQDHGVRTKLEVVPGVPHGHIANPQLKSAQQASGQFVKAVGWIMGEEKSDEDLQAVLREAHWRQV